MNKIVVFLVTLLVGLVVTVNTVISEGFTPSGIRNWIVDSLFVSAVVGFALVKYLQHKDIWPKSRR